MKKVRLNENSEELKKFQDAILSKAHAQRTMLGYLSQFVTIDETTLFEGDIKQNAIELFKNKYASDFPSYLAIEKIMELVDFSLSTFQTLIDKYKFFEVDGYNPITQSALIKDFGVYAETPEQISRYKESKSIVDALKKVSDKVANGVMARQQLTQLIPIISYNAVKNDFEINVRYILGAN